MADEKHLLCYNKGCGQNYDPQDNKGESCKYHPGVPVFHDALKGWSCCKKRSTDFSEFLSIPGCTSGAHTHEKPEPVQPVVQTSKEKAPQKEVADCDPTVPKYVETPMIEPVSRPSIDEPMLRLPATVAASLKQALDKQMQQLEISADTTNSDASSEIKVGESCKNNSCSKSYVDSSSNEETCNHHPGVAVFHEGMKFWSCCRRKTSDFNNFLSQEGCTEGKHVWMKKEDPNKKVACRYDWHQTPGFVTMSVFAKVCLPDQTWVEVNKVFVKIHITFEKGKSIFCKEIPLRGIIDPSKSNVKLLGTKVEINMKKAEVGKWPTLELEQQEQQPPQDDGDQC